MNSYCSLQNGETALHIAARHGQLKMVSALLEEGTDPTQHSKVRLFTNAYSALLVPLYIVMGYVRTNICFLT